MVVCEQCEKGGEGGPLLKIAKGHYCHKRCLPSQGGNVEDVQMPLHSHPKLWISQMKPPSLEDIRGKRA